MEILNKKINSIVDDKLQTAVTYYKIIMSINNIKLTSMEYNMLALLAVYGSISSPPNRERFIKYFNSTENSINTTISNMYKKKLIKKINGKNIIIDSLKQDFNKPHLLNIFLASKDILNINNTNTKQEESVSTEENK